VWFGLVWFGLVCVYVCSCLFYNRSLGFCVSI
jgi:hypothetical protein